MRTNGERSPEEIQAEIERARREMDHTLSEIERKLTPGELVDQGLAYLRHSGAAEYARNLGVSAKTNPLPLALVAVGIGWLMWTQRGGAPQPGLSASRIGEAAGAVSGAVGSAADRLRETGRTVSDTARRATQAARELGDTASRRLEQAKTGADTLLREQPLALGALGLAIGAALGAAVPRSKLEDQVMGPASDRLAGKARETGEELLHKVQAKVEDGMEQQAAAPPPGSPL